MTDCEIQPLLWPKPGLCDEEAMYFRRDAQKIEYYPTRDRFSFKRGGAVLFDTYFNSFSLQKWYRYTTLERLGIRLRFCGSFQVVLLGWRYRNGAVVPEALTSHKIESERQTEATICFPTQNQMLQDVLTVGFSLQALSEGAKLYGGAWVGTSQRCVDAALALNICTHRRERFVHANVERLRTEIFEKPEHPLRNKLFVYITDNAGTLEQADFPEKEISLFTQNEKGSSGGFARGQLEIMRDQNKLGLTHMIYMDDDICFDPGVLVRNYWFLRFLKPEYSEYVVGGALMRMNFPFLQMECGAQWGVNTIIAVKPGLDMRRLDHVLFSEIEEKVDYQGWWYCCVPLNKADNFPLPVYFHWDDVEFGLRQKGFLHLNGLCVWHDDFENKASSKRSYYDFRNRLIVNSIHCEDYSAREAIRDARTTFLIQAATFRYREAALTLRAARDFCRGCDWVLNNDGAGHDAEIEEAGYTLKPLSECGENFDIGQYEWSWRAPCPQPRWKRALRLAKEQILPRSGCVTVRAFMPPAVFFLHNNKALNYNSADETAFVTQKSLREFCALLREYRSVRRVMRRSFGKAAQSWKTFAETGASKSFWEAKLLPTNKKNRKNKKTGGKK